MAIKTEQNCYICRASRSSKTYKDATDIMASSKILKEPAMFLSYNQVITDSNTLFHITAPMDNDHIDENVPYDYWVSAAFIEYYDLEDSNPDSAKYKDTNEYFLVNKREISIYDNSRVLTPLSDKLLEGDFIEVDKIFIHKDKERKIPRYRIKAVNDRMDHKLVGKWMEGNPTIYTNGKKIIYSDLNIAKVDPNDPTLLKNKIIEDDAYVDLGNQVLEAAGSDPTSKGSNNKGSYQGPKEKSFWNGKKYVSINTVVVKRAVEMAKVDNHPQVKESFYTGTFLNATDEANKNNRYWAIYYYDLAALEKGKEMFTGSRNNSTSKAWVNIIRFAEGKSDWEKFSSAIVNKANPISQSIWATNSTVVKSNNTATIADGTIVTSGDAAAVDQAIADGNVAEAVPATPAWDEAAWKEQRYSDIADMEAEIEETTLDDLFTTYGLYWTGDSSINEIPIGRLSFVHGMPFQYTYLTDRRLNDDTNYGRELYNDDQPMKGSTMDMYGRTFAREIAANTPIVVFTPGRPKFMSNIKQSIFGYSSASGGKLRNRMAMFFSDLTDFELGDAIKQMYDDNDDEIFQYYSLEIDTVAYYGEVNALCQTSAKLMNLKDFKMRNTPCDQFNWAKYNTNEAHDYSTREEVFGVSQGVSFAFDPLSSIQDSLNNNIGESIFALLFNGISDKSRELSFILGTNIGDTDLDLIDTDEYRASLAQQSDGIMHGLHNPLSVAGSMIKNAAHGMRIRFPQLWQDSSFSKNYSLDMKFVTPYATNFCKWRYVLVPFFHLFALAAPKSKDTIISYSRPYLIKAYSRGYFNIEMGIIDGISWKRYGEGDMLAVDTIPTEIDVSVDITDLYQQLASSTIFGDAGGMSLNRIKVFFNNAGLQELLGSLAGIDTNRITLPERLSMFTSTAKGAFKATGINWAKHIWNRQVTQRIMRRFYGLNGNSI